VVDAQRDKEEVFLLREGGRLPLSGGRLWVCDVGGRLSLCGVYHDNNTMGMTLVRFDHVQECGVGGGILRSGRRQGERVVSSS